MEKDAAESLKLPGKLSLSRIKTFEAQGSTPPSPQIQNRKKKPIPERQVTLPTKMPSQKTDVLAKPNDQPLPDNPIFHSPMVLVSTVDGKPQCKKSTLLYLNDIEQSLNVVSVVGTLRTGKSFILNKLATHASVDNKSYFETGHTTTAVTKGIWVLCRPHPTQKDQVLVLLDTEGIDDPDKVEMEDDKNWFILSTLMSSTLVYNTRGNVDRTAIDKFKFLSKIKTSIKVNGSEEDDSILDFFFPNFVLTLRDVTLDCHCESDDSYLENTLKLKRNEQDSASKRESIRNYNLPRILIRRYFKNRKCFRFRKPIKQSKLEDLMAVKESDMKEEFQKTLNEFRYYVYSCQPKTLKSGKAINGRMFSSLLLNYVNAIQMGETPCLTSAMFSMAAVENTHVVKKATDVYNAEMKKRIASYAPSERGLVNYHKDSMKAALEILKSELVIDDEQIYEEQAMATFKAFFEKFENNVKTHMEEKCYELLSRLDTMKIQMKIKNRRYCTRGGYDEYMKDIDSLVQQFKREAGYMGSVATTALQTFLDGKVAEEEIVYKMVLEATDLEEGDEPQRRKVKRLTIFQEDDERIIQEEKDVEAAINADIEMIQENGLKHIEEQYIGMLKTKIQEVDRVKRELTRNNSVYHQLCKETKHWKDIFNKATLNMPHYKKPSNAEEKDATCMLETVYNEPWENVIDPLWKKAMEESFEGDDVSVTSEDSADENDSDASQRMQKDPDGITVLPDRTPPEGMSDDPIYCDPVSREGYSRKGKCDIL